MKTILEVSEYLEQRIKTLEYEMKDIQYFMGHKGDYLYLAKIGELEKLQKVIRED
jgi:hypothetical protein